MKDVMKLAWKYKRVYRISIGSAMKLAWTYFKTPLTEFANYLNLVSTIYVCIQMKGVKNDTNRDETGIEENGYESDSIYKLDESFKFITSIKLERRNIWLCRSNPRVSTKDGQGRATNLSISKRYYLISGSGIYRYYHPPNFNILSLFIYQKQEWKSFQKNHLQRVVMPIF
jgi:hypothetical protein